MHPPVTAAPPVLPCAARRATPQAAAVAYAALLDRIAACNPGGRVEEVLAAVGELLGGLGADGFVADLDAASDAIEERMRDEHPGEWSHGRGGTDPDAGISDWLWDRICDAQNELARGWLRDAAAIMAAPVRPAALFFRRAA